MKGAIIMSRMFSKKSVSLLIAMIAVLTSLVMSVPVFAYESMDTSRNGNSSITLQLPAPSSNVKLYFVADMDENTHITMKEEYKDLGVTLDDVDSADDWMDKAAALSAQLIGSAIQPAVAATDENNQAKFENLSFGIYLVVVDGCADQANKYKITPNFISVPNSTDGETWIYDVNATLKYEAEPTPPPPGKVKFVVQKLWSKDGTGISRPTELVVEILKRSKDSDPWTVVETVKLNAGNSWRYSWEAEADDSTWSVREVTNLKNYVLDKVETTEPKEGDPDGAYYFILTNRYITPTPTPTVKITSTPTPTPRTRITATPTPRVTITPRIPHTTPKTGDDQNIILPIIGVLAAGVVLVLLGFNVRKKSGKDE